MALAASKPLFLESAFDLFLAWAPVYALIIPFVMIVFGFDNEISNKDCPTASEITSKW